MGSTFTTIPNEYAEFSTVTGNKKSIPTFIQFVPGIVVKVTTGSDSLSHNGDSKRLGSIIAMPHFGDKGIKKPSLVNEEFRYYPLLRGVQETPTPGDPVVLCTIGGVQYYLGPLNTEGNPNFNNDKFINNQVRNDFDKIVKSEGSLESRLFIKSNHKRLQKLLNSKLDSPFNTGEFISNTIHGDLVLEGRHGNSIRIGSRNVNPYIIISNGRSINNPIETTLDGTIVGIFEHGSIRDHFNLDPVDDDTGVNYKFKLADEEHEPVVHNSILNTFSTPLGSGRTTQLDDISMDDTIYQYSGSQLFQSSDRVTINAKKESMFLSSKKHIHVGSGNTITFSTSNNIFTQAAKSVVTNVPEFNIHSETVVIDGDNKVIIGNPLKNHNIQPAVVGDGLVTALSLIIDEIKNLAYSVTEAVENRAKAGGSLDIMQERIDALDSILGVVGYDDPILEQSYEIPENLSNLILSNRVFVRK